MLPNRITKDLMASAKVGMWSTLASFPTPVTREALSTQAEPSRSCNVSAEKPKVKKKTMVLVCEGVQSQTLWNLEPEVLANARRIPVAKCHPLAVTIEALLIAASHAGGPRFSTLYSPFESRWNARPFRFDQTACSHMLDLTLARPRSVPA